MLCDRAQDDIWLRNSSWHTHTHEMSYEMFRRHCHSRCRISWRRSRAADLRILRSKDSLEQKVVLTFRRVLANICRPVMETVPVLTFGKFGENRKKKWTKYGEHLWTILVLPSSFPLVLSSKFHWNVISVWLALPRPFSDMYRLHVSNLLDTSMFMRSACVPWARR